MVKKRNKMTEINEPYYAECLITYNTKYCLIDGDNDIRATAHDKDGINRAKKHYGWGVIHALKRTKNSFYVGRKIT